MQINSEKNYLKHTKNDLCGGHSNG